MAGKMKKYTQMSEEIEQLDVELTDVLGKIRGDIEALDWDTSKVNASKEEREAEFERIKAAIANARSVHQNYRVEMRDLGREEIAHYGPKAKSHLNAIEELARTLNFTKAASDKRELVGDKAERKGPDANTMGAAQLIEEAKKTQGQDLEAVNRMTRMVDDSEQVGVETNVKLKMQTEQMKNIHTEVGSVQANMDRAEKLINQIGRRLATDKLIACMILLLLLLIFIIIIVKSFGLDQDPNALANGYVIDCNLDITKTQKQCRELAAAAAAAAGGATPAPTPAPTPRPTPAPTPLPTPAPSEGTRRAEDRWRRL